MASRRLILTVDLEVGHEADVAVRSNSDLVAFATDLLKATPLPDHVRWGRIVPLFAPEELTPAQEAALAQPSASDEAKDVLFEARLAKFLIEFKKTRQAIENKQGHTIQSESIQQALVASLKLPGTQWLPERELSTAEMLRLLEGYCFDQIIERAHTDENLLPSDLLRRLDEEQRKHKGQIWEIHKNDADPWPSNPHAHNVETGYKLDLSNGDIYDPSKKRKESFVKRMAKKQLLTLRALFTTALPELQVT